ncbi:MAG: hypothetical protein ACC641_03935 [Acidiferrobacterales bacterium]
MPTLRTHFPRTGSAWIRLGSQLTWITVLASQLLLSGCQSTTPKKPPSDTSIAIISSNNTRIFKEVALGLKNKLGKQTQVSYLTGNARKDQRVIQQLNSSDRKQVVTIGLRASRLGKQLTNKQVVFSQVFNYRQYGLVTPFRKGVTAVPPPGQVFRKWKQLAPNLKTVLSITGKLHGQMIKEAQLEARRYGIRLKHLVVRSDKEFIYTYKQNVGKYQGLWLLPDNRVLSRKVIHNIMSFSIKNGIQVMVFSPQLLQIGGLVSATAVSDDVVEQVYKRLQDGSGQFELPGPAVTALTRVDFRVNDVVARQLGLAKRNNRKKY